MPALNDGPLPLGLIQALKRCAAELSCEDAADAIWLAAVAQGLGVGDRAHAGRSELDSQASAAPTLHRAAAGPKDPPTGTHPELAVPMPPRESLEEPKREVRSALYHEGLRGRLSGTSIRVPGAAALPDKRSLLRALRPVIRRTHSVHCSELDMNRTVQLAATEGLFEPCQRPRLERWLHLHLLIERSVSMQLWQPVIAELLQLLKSSRGFASVRSYTLDSSAEGGQRLHPEWPGLAKGSFSGKSARQRRLPALTGPGAHAVWVLSDCASDPWYDGRIVELLRAVQTRLPLAILHLFPPHLQERTAVGLALPLSLHASTAMARSAALATAPRHSAPQWTQTQPMPTPEEGAQAPVVAPLLSLEPRSLRAWARTLVATSDNSVAGIELLAPLEGTSKPEPPPDLQPLRPDAAQRVRAFRASATHDARKLAILLTELPLVSLPVLRLVRQVFLPNSRFHHEAEVLLGDLLQIVPDAADAVAANQPDRVLYDFAPGVRALLNELPWPRDAAAPRPTRQELLIRIGAYIEANYGSPRGFRAILASLDELAQSSSEFAILGERLKAQLGPRHSSDDRPPQQKPTPSRDKLGSTISRMPGTVYDPALYVSRPRIESTLANYGRTPGTATMIVAPPLFGKTWLLRRVAETLAPEVCVSFLSMRQLDASAFASHEEFLKMWARNILLAEGASHHESAEKLLETAWNKGAATAPIKFRRLLSAYLTTPQPDRKHLALLIDDVDIVAQQSFAAEFFAFLRSLLENPSLRNGKYLSLILSTKRSIQFAERSDSSPFSSLVHLIELPDFDLTQAKVMSERSGLDWSGDSLQNLSNLIGGHPYLLRIAITASSQQGMSIDQLLAPGASVFESYLRDREVELQKDPELYDGLQRILRDRSTKISRFVAESLEAMGFIVADGLSMRAWRPRYALYARLGERATFSQTVPNYDPAKPPKLSWQEQHTVPRLQTRGALRLDSLYVLRAADQELLESLMQGDYCLVLAPRQSGKSSLSLRTSLALKERGIRCGHIDLAGFGSYRDIPSPIDAFFHDFINELAEQFSLPDPSDAWSASSTSAPSSRFIRYLKDTVLTNILEPMVLFIDEFDYLRTMPWEIHEFLFAIRSAFDERSHEPVFRRLTLCLLTQDFVPGWQIRSDDSALGFAQIISLEDFSQTEVQSIASALVTEHGTPASWLDEIYAWTGGHPYMTMRLLEVLLSDRAPQRDTIRDNVAAAAESAFMRGGAMEDSNLGYAEMRLSNSPIRSEATSIYASLLQSSSPAQFDRQSPAQHELVQCGMVKETTDPTGKRVLVIRNRIYATVFDLDWVRKKHAEWA